MKYALTLLLCFFGLLGKGQHLKLSQLKSFVGQPVASVSDSLKSTRWVVRPELSAVKGDQLYRTFSYGNHGSERTKALSWLRIQADYGVVNQLYYQLNSQASYELILKDIKASGTEKKDIQSIENKQISTYYLSTDYIFQTIVGADSYTIMVMSSREP